MPINSKIKGKQGELEFCKALAALGFEASRGVQYRGDKSAPDVITSIDGVHFEVKRVEKLYLYKAMEQAERDGPDDIHVIAHRASRRPWVVCVKLDQLKDFARAVLAED